MRRYLLYRVLQLVPVTLVVIILNFLLVHLAPGDVSIILAGESADPAYLASIRERYGLDRPFLEQLWRYLVQVGSGDLGVSFRS
ncbi:MAG TPA: glutathione ABC transporter permease GsiC, partial [Thermomicrobiales bacterium]|nr:glutathione ABC transporter permease GsiC [Thermomicrobiales bacterium]